MHPLRLLVVLGLVLAVGAPDADACKCCGPCSKYDKQRIKYPKVAKPGVYMRAAGGTFKSFTRSKVVAFLTGAAWDAVLPGGTRYPADMKAPPKLRFVDAAKITARSRTTNDVRLVVVRRIEYREAEQITLIEVDNERFALVACEAVPKRMCLSRRNDLDFEPVE